MTDDKSSAKHEHVQDREQAGALEDLPRQEVSKDGADQVKGGKKLNWDIPAGTASPSA